MLEEIIMGMESNMRYKLRYISECIDSMQVYEVDKTQVVFSGMPSDTFNTAFGGSITSSATEKVMQSYVSKQMPMAWWSKTRGSR